MSEIAYFRGNHSLSALEVRWCAAAGRFILNFGSIEWVTLNLLAELPTERIFESTRTLSLSKRIEIVQQLIMEKVFIDFDVRDEAVKTLDEAKKLIEVRNLLAHNPILLDLFNIEEGVKAEYKIFKHGETHHRLTLNELEIHCREVETLVSRLHELREALNASY